MKTTATILKRTVYSCAVALALGFGSPAKAYETMSQTNISPLAQVLLGSGIALAPQEGTTFGNNAQIGLFSNLVSAVVPFTNGVILSTGNIGAGYSLSNNAYNTQGTLFGGPGDPDIQNEFG